jgi:hypothetical protein
MDYSKQANLKLMQIDEPHPDRNTQFEYLNPYTESANFLCHKGLQQKQNNPSG